MKGKVVFFGLIFLFVLLWRYALNNAELHDESYNADTELPSYFTNSYH